MRAPALRWPFELRLVPVKERRKLWLAWPLTVEMSAHRDPRMPALAYLTHLLGHEGDGSLYAALQAEGLATAVSAGSEAASEFALLKLMIDLPPLGEAHVDHVAQRVYEYLAVLADEGASEAARTARYS